ncbi:hypothetical protein BGY98DRAFT_1031252 [Russula aff. rugulosa BPL654]|nr:hypothetical protein BGY98DRAFT_1031252 [Russula aff. rugulosa BPL654]
MRRSVLDVLTQQIMLGGLASRASMELRRLGLETLRQILLVSGHTLLVGWKTIFEVLGSVCRLPACPFRPCFIISSFLARTRVYPTPPCSGMR